jgi:hypothetical protein
MTPSSARPAFRAPAADHEARVDRRVESGAIDAGLAAGDDSDEGHGGILAEKARKR